MKDNRLLFASSMFPALLRLAGRTTLTLSLDRGSGRSGTGPLDEAGLLSEAEAKGGCRPSWFIGEKRLLASYVLENTGTIEELRDKLSNLLKTIA